MSFLTHTELKDTSALTQAVMAKIYEPKVRNVLSPQQLSDYFSALTECEAAISSTQTDKYMFAILRTASSDRMLKDMPTQVRGLLRELEGRVRVWKQGLGLGIRVGLGFSFAYALSIPHLPIAVNQSHKSRTHG